MLPHGHAAKAPQDHLVVGVVPGVPYSHVLEYMTVHNMELLCLGPHILDVMDHDPHLAVPCPRNLEIEEVLHHIP